MKILITGVDGFLGKKLFQVIGREHDVYGTSRKTERDKVYFLDVTDEKNSEKIIENLKPDVLVHAAALVDVEKSEREKNLAHNVNTLAPKFFAMLCSKYGIKMVYFSSDYVFDGREETYKTNSPRKPINYYGETKKNAEISISKILKDSVILRPSILYGLNGFDDKKNFVLNVLESLKKDEEIVLDNERIKYPLLIDDLAEEVLRLIESRSSGIFNMSGPDAVTKYEWGIRIAHIFGFKHEKIIGKDLNETNRPHKVKFDVDALIGKHDLEEGLKLIRKQLEQQDFVTLR